MRLPQDRVAWCPPYALRKITATEQTRASPKNWDILFVGKVEPQVNPERVVFLQKLKQIIPALDWRSGDFRKFFPRAKLVLNHCIAGDLNFRTMEALACGSCLLTPNIGHGLQELFTDGEDLFMYNPEELPALGELVRQLLQNPALCAKVAASGLQKVNAGHLGEHRALLLDRIWRKHLQGNNAAHMVQDRLARKADIHAQYLKLIYLLFAESMELPVLRQAYLAAAKA
jgi:glycosyltransferase involved in cell wall biosynthesis